MRISLTQLRTITTKLFDYLEETDRTEFHFEEDYYWRISEDEVYDPSADPTVDNLEVGQLSDDWNELQQIMEDDELSIGYALVWLSSILRRIGEKNVY